ncbi:MAG: hypothetical protein ACOVO1_07910 [Chitinophagaceae bacterium]
MINNHLKKILYSLFLAFQCGCSGNCDDEIDNLEINGKVISKQKLEMPCYGSIIYLEKNKVKEIKVCFCVPSSEDIWTYVQKNDSIYKEIGNSLINVYRNGKPVNFEYPCCNQ